MTESKQDKVRRWFLPKPLIYLITGGELTSENFAKKTPEILRVIEKAVEAEVSLIQIREKKLSAKLLFELVRGAASVTRNSPVKLLINDRGDIALAAGADGVHLTSKSLPADVIRQSFPPEFLIGVSAHTPEEIEKAKLGKADWATFGPIFPTPSKARYGAPQGIGKLREAVKRSGDFPVLAIGGIDQENFAEALRAGAAGVAAIRFLNDGRNLPEIVKKIRDYQEKIQSSAG